MQENTVKVRVPGTTANCGPGFDSVGIACTIYNELELTLRNDHQLIIEVHGEGCKNIVCDERNIVWKSMQVLFQQAGFAPKGAYIKMLNHVPLSRGLGSSAAAIVAGLFAANAAIGAGYDKQEIFQMATQIEGHPDNVAPAIFGGVTLSIVKDGIAETLSFVPEKKLKMIVAVPSFNLSTKLARKVLPLDVSMKDAIFNISRTALLVGSLCKGEFSYLRHALEDALHQPYRTQLIPGMQDVFDAANQHGALGAALSGAGPCLIAFATNNMQNIGEAMVAAFNKNDVEAKYFILDIDETGVQII